MAEFADTIRSFLSLFMFLCTFFIFVPQGIDFIKKWKKSGKTQELTCAICFFVFSFFFLSANYIVFIKMISKWQI